MFNQLSGNTQTSIFDNHTEFTTASVSSICSSGVSTPSLGLTTTPVAMETINTTASLEDLQTEEQRQVLDIIAQTRKCGLEGTLSLPQIVVCGDQSAGKSSVLEAITEIPFPRNDNLCTRHATEIILKRADRNSLTIKVIPDGARPQAEKTEIEQFQESITDFADLPRIMDRAMTVMGIGSTSTLGSLTRAFARDVLSIEIEGPSRPQLTLVDIPGLIATDTKGVTKADVALVTEITDYYISQPRTICLAVISALNDYANQKILTKVREVDPEGNRTLGIITKPDRLEAGSGSEKAFIELARNEDIFFKLGWHVLKNRSFKEGDASFMERNDIERSFFLKSNFNCLPQESVGIETLRTRLASLLFEHVKRELPNLRQELEEALADTKGRLAVMGASRSSVADCKSYLSELNLEIYEVCKSAVHGYYEGEYFHRDSDQAFSIESPSAIARLRAVVQHMNTEFSNYVRVNGHKYDIKLGGDYDDEDEETEEEDEVRENEETEETTGTTSIHTPATKVSSPDRSTHQPIQMSRSEALNWVKMILVSTRGQELAGDFNPLLVGELFWEQSSRWRRLAEEHVERVQNVCKKFLEALLREKCPEDVRTRIWSTQIMDPLKSRGTSASKELDLIIEDFKNYPINYNHYYTDTIQKRRQDRLEAALSQCVAGATQHIKLPGCSSNHTSAHVDIEQVLAKFSKRSDPDMENFSCEEALDRLFAIYKVHQKTFIANVTTQVIERHIVRGLERLFSPVVVSSMTDTQVITIASEAPSAKRQRDHLESQIAKLEEGHEIFKGVMGTVRG